MLPSEGYKTKRDYFCTLKKTALLIRRLGELNFHKRCTEARESKISVGNLERTYPKGFRHDIPRSE